MNTPTVYYDEVTGTKMTLKKSVLVPKVHVDPVTLRKQRSALRLVLAAQDRCELSFEQMIEVLDVARWTYDHDAPPPRLAGELMDPDVTVSQHIRRPATL